MSKIKTLFLETTNRCNANCVMCTHQFMKRKTQDMNFELLTYALRQAQPKTAVLHFFGEPLLYPYLADAISYAHRRGILTVIDTNAQLLTEDRFIKLAKEGLDRVIISFGAVTPEVYSSIWRRLDYKTVTRNIIDSYMAKKNLSLRTKIQIRTIVTKENIHQLSDIKRKWSHFCDKWTKSEEFHLPGYDRTPWRKTNKPNCKVRNRLYNECIIKSNGDMVLCCNDLDGDYVIGNILEKPLMELWNGDTYNDYRRRVYKRQNPPAICEECVVRPW